MLLFILSVMLPVLPALVFLCTPLCLFRSLLFVIPIGHPVLIPDAKSVVFFSVLGVVQFHGSPRNSQCSLSSLLKPSIAQCVAWWLKLLGLSVSFMISVLHLFYPFPSTVTIKLQSTLLKILSFTNGWSILSWLTCSPSPLQDLCIVFYLASWEFVHRPPTWGGCCRNKCLLRCSHWWR